MAKIIFELFNSIKTQQEHNSGIEKKVFCSIWRSATVGQVVQSQKKKEEAAKQR